jgi:PAS domain-containing protein
MTPEVAEVVLMGAGAVLLLAGSLWLRSRFLLLDELQRYARRLSEADYTAAPPKGSTGSLRELVQALTSLGEQLRDVRVTEKGKLETARRQAEAVIEAMPDPVLVFDGDARVVRFNSAAHQALGDKLAVGAAAGDLGNPVLTLAAEEASVGFPVAGNQVPQVRLPALNEDAEPRIFRARALPLSDSASAAGAVLVLQDVSEAASEVDLVRHAALTALVEIRPLIDGLGVLLLGSDAGASQETPGYREWMAVDRILRDLEAAGVEPTREKLDLGRLTEEAVTAVGLEAQRRRVKVETRIAVPAPQLVTDTVAAERLLLRTLRSALQLNEPGGKMTVEVREKPRPQIRISPGFPKGTIPSAIDAVLLERARAALLHERGAPRGTTVIQFAPET